MSMEQSQRFKYCNPDEKKGQTTSEMANFILFLRHYIKNVVIKNEKNLRNQLRSESEIEPFNISSEITHPIENVILKSTP